MYLEVVGGTQESRGDGVVDGGLVGTGGGDGEVELQVV